MACSIRNRGKIYRKFRLDIWGYYTTYNNRLSKRAKLDDVLKYWIQVDKVFFKYKWFKRRRYVYKLWNRERFKFPKRLKPNYVKPRLLRHFYIYLRKHTYVTYIQLSYKGKLTRGFVSTFLNYLEGRLIMIVYRLNLINNLFLIKKIVEAGIFFVNYKKKQHINTRMQLGDLLHLEKTWGFVLKKDMFLRLEQGIIIKNISNFYMNYEKMYFFFYRPYKYSDINYPIRIDLYRAMDFIGPLR